MNPPVRIRPIEPADADAYVGLYSAIAAEGIWIGGELPLSDVKVDRLRRSANGDDPAQTSFVADADGQLVGWASVRYAPYGRTDLGMGVLDGFRRRGIGRRLLDAVVAWSRERGAHKVDLEVWPHNDAAIALYERAGFVREGYRRRHWRRNNGELWDSVEMSLEL